MEWIELPSLFSFAGPERWVGLLQRHAAMVEEAAERVRVTSVAPGEAVRRHYAESLELWRIALEAEADGPLVDVGSGGGFPGLVIATVEPELEMHLVEPLQKRAALLKEMALALGLANVTVHAERAEEAGRGVLRDYCGTVVARAVAPLRELLEYTAPLCRPGGLVALPKGSSLAEELEGASTAMETLGVSYLETVPMRPEVSETVRVALFRKVGPTPAGYPRRPGVPGKRPL